MDTFWSSSEILGYFLIECKAKAKDKIEGVDQNICTRVYLLIYLLIRTSLISLNGLEQNFQLSGFAMGRAFAEVPVEDVTLDWGC